MNQQLGNLPPHIYAIANEVYVSLWRMRHSQCVLIRLEVITVMIKGLCVKKHQKHILLYCVLCVNIRKLKL